MSHQCNDKISLGNHYPLGGIIEQISDGVAYEGTSTTEVFRRSRDAHWTMRRNYLPMIENVGRNIYPVIVSLDNIKGEEGQGGVYVFRRAPGETYTAKPTPPVYELFKTVSHIVLGVFTIVGPSMKNPLSTVWKDPLSRYIKDLELTLHSLPNAVIRKREPEEPYGSVIEPHHAERIERVLTGTITSCKKMVETGDASHEAFKAFTKPLIEDIRLNMVDAGRIQLEAVAQLLAKWKAMVSEKEWDNLYVLVNTIWPVAIDSPREVILRLFMNPDKVESNLLICNGSTNIDDSLTLLGRVVADREVARSVFNDYECNALTASLVDSLSSPRDVVSDSAYEALDEIVNGKAHSKFLRELFADKKVDPRNLLHADYTHHSKITATKKCPFS